jgi:hypothetical protein
MPFHPACRRLSLLGSALLLAAAPDSLAEEAPAATVHEDGVSAGGSLAWIFSDDLDLVGELAADLPWNVTPRTELFFGLWTQTAITGSIGDLTFEVGALDYSAQLGVRRALDSGRTLWLFTGQDGKSIVDSDGSAFARYVACGVESAVARGAGLYWLAAAGPVLDDAGVSADAWTRVDVQWDPASWREHAASRFGFDLSLRGLLDGGDLDADLEVGPHYLFQLTDRYRLSLFAHYLDGDDPLGLATDGVLVGFEYFEDAGARGSRMNPPDIQGRVSVGGGEGRVYSDLEVDLEYPPFPVGGWLATDFDVNALSGADADELYYFYRVGYEHPLAGTVAGVYFYHRSNHQLSAPNEVTSINVAQLGVETPSWRGPIQERPRAGWGRLDWTGNAGYLVSSDFGEDRGWWLLGGARYVLPRGVGSFVPLLEAEFEGGDASRYSLAAGVAAPWGTLLEVRYLADEQYFGSDDSAFLVVAERRF